MKDEKLKALFEKARAAIDADDCDEGNTALYRGNRARSE
jgi:hypothetical protein